MITLATGGTLKGKAGTGAANITYTIYGDAVTTTDAFQVLGQGVLSTSAADLLTTTPVPSSTNYLVKEIQFANTSGSQVTGLILYVNGSAAGNQICGGWTVQANGSATLDAEGIFRSYDLNGLLVTTSSVTLTGDVAGSGAGTIATTLKNTGPGVTGPTGSATATPSVTIDAQGRVTALTSNTIAIPESAVTNLTTDLAAKQATGNYITALTGDVAATGPGSASSTVSKINGTALSGLATGLLKNTTGTGVPSIAAAGTDYVAATSGSAIQKASSGNLTAAVAADVPTVAAGGTGALSATDASVTNSRAPNGSASGDLSASYPGPTVAKLQGTAVSSTVPLIGQNLEYGPTSWMAATNYYNVIDFGATPNTSTDSTLAFYNAIISCGIQALATKQWTLTAQGTTTSTTFSLTVTANAAASSTGNIIMQTTSGLVYASYTGGTTTTLACTWIAGVPGGNVLNGSIVGVPTTYAWGGKVRIPAGIYYTSQEITNSIPGVHFEGDSSGFLYAAGNWTMTGGSWIYYNGVVGGTALRNVPLTGTSGPWSGQQLNGIRVSGINVQGNQLAAHGIAFISCGGFTMENTYVEECLVSQYEYTTVASGMLAALQTTDNHRAIVRNCYYDSTIGGTGTGAQIVAANVNQTALTSNINTFTGSTNLTVIASPGTINAAWAATNGYCRIQALDTVTGTMRWYLASYTAASGTTISGVHTLGLYPNQSNVTTANAATPPTGASALPSATLFSGSLIQPATGPFANGYRLHGSLVADTCCVDFHNVDGNYYVGTGVDIGATDSNYWFDCLDVQVVQAGLSSYGRELQGSKGQIVAARNNHMIGGSPGIGGINVRGTNSFGYTLGAQANYWDGQQLANGEPVALVGTGATYYTWYNGSLRVGGNVLPPTAISGTLTVSAANVMTGTLIQLPPSGIYAGLWLRYKLYLTKTAAGVATWTAAVKFGTAGTGSDGAIATLTSGTNTALIDSVQIDIDFQVLTVGSGGTCAAIACVYAHAGTATTGLGLATGPVVLTAATLNTTGDNPGPSYFHLDVTPGTAAVMTGYATVEVMR